MVVLPPCKSPLYIYISYKLLYFRYCGTEPIPTQCNTFCKHSKLPCVDPKCKVKDINFTFQFYVAFKIEIIKNKQYVPSSPILILISLFLNIDSVIPYLSAVPLILFPDQISINTEGLLHLSNDWISLVDLDNNYVFPPHIALTAIRPDIVV